MAVARDFRWGRTYESYSSDETVVASYAGGMVEAMQADELFPGVVAFIDELRAAGVGVALGSSSKNAPLILRTAYNALKPRGILIFNERWWDQLGAPGDTMPLMSLDVLYHAIRVKRGVDTVICAVIAP